MLRSQKRQKNGMVKSNEGVNEDVTTSGIFIKIDFAHYLITNQLIHNILKFNLPKMLILGYIKEYIRKSNDRRV